MYESRKGWRIMEIKQLQYFVVSVNTGSFKKAAEVLYTTQPHISKVLKGLETELGMILLKRDSRGVTLTAEGKDVYAYANEILVNSNRITHLKKQTKEQVLSIGAESVNDVVQLFSEFYRANGSSDMHYRYLEGNSAELMKLLHQHKIEIGFLYVSDMQRSIFETTCEKKRLKFTALGEADPVLLVGPKSELYHLDSIDVTQLKNQKFISGKEDLFSLGNYVGQFGEGGLRYQDLEQVITTDSSRAMMHILMETTLCSLSIKLHEKHFESTRIRAIPITNMKSGISFGYIARARTGISKEAEKFIAFFKQNEA